MTAETIDTDSEAGTRWRTRTRGARDDAVHTYRGASPYTYAHHGMRRREPPSGQIPPHRAPRSSQAPRASVAPNYRLPGSSQLVAQIPGSQELPAGNQNHWSKSTAVDPVTTWVLHPRRDRHIGSLPGLCDTLELGCGASLSHIHSLQDCRVSCKSSPIVWPGARISLATGQFKPVRPARVRGRYEGYVER